MTPPSDGRHDESAAGDFEQQAQRASRRKAGALREFGYFLRRTRNWWMAPILAALLLVSALLVLSGTAVAPLIYALF
jgi:hypothetical protein